MPEDRLEAFTTLVCLCDKHDLCEGCACHCHDDDGEPWIPTEEDLIQTGFYRCVCCLSVCDVDKFNTDGPIKYIIRCPKHGDLVGWEEEINAT